MNLFKKLFGKEQNPIWEGAKATTLESVLAGLAKQEIRLSYCKTDDALPVGSSKLGGQPDLPADFLWPEYEGEGYGDNCVKRRPLAFLAQINLKDVANFDREGLLPKTGLLSFFYEVVSMRWGFDVKDRGCARVFYFPETESLRSTPLHTGLDRDGILPACEISFEPHLSLPSYESFDEMDASKVLGEVDWDAYDECCEEMGVEPDEMGERTKLLGYPDLIQNPMEEECEMISRGYYCGNPEGYAKVTPQEKEDIRKKAKDWVLLFQMGTIETEGYELMFGDCGHIYFWIRKDDLIHCRFDKIWLILQCS